MSVRSSPMPPTHVGHGRRSGVHGGRRLGLDIHRHRALERRVRRLACVQARRPLRRPSADLHGACEAVCLDLRRCGAGLALRMDHGSQYLSDHFTNQIKFWGIQPSYAFVEQPQTKRRRREVQSHAQGTDHPWPHLPQHRGAAERRPRVRRTVQCPVDRGEERLPEPRSSSSGVAHRDVTQARRMRQTCVQGTGCDTVTCNVSHPHRPLMTQDRKRPECIAAVQW